MLSSITKLPKTPWNAGCIQFCAKSNATNIKALNFDSKALFGAVKKRTPGEKESVTNSSINTLEDESTSSEMYWLLEHKPEMNKIKKTTLKPRKKSAKLTGSDCKNATSNLKATAAKKSPKPNEEKIEDPSRIPFDSKGLKAILKFPIVLVGQTQPIITENTTYTGRTPSVGQILQATMSEGSRKALINWKLTKIAELGEEGFKALQQDHLNKGKLLHKALQDYLLSGSQPTIPPETTNLWESVLPALETLKPKPELIEARVQHPFLKYRGIVDCVSKIGNTLSVIEWKKSDKLKTTIDATYDAPVQLCAYLGALSADPRYKLEAHQGYVIVAYTDSKPAEVHYMNEIQLRKYWDIWLKKVQEFWVRTRDGTLPEPI